MLDLETPIPTPTGWKRLGSLRAGDALFSEKGEVCRVAVVHPIVKNPVSYRVLFDDGEEVFSCEDHRWLTFDHSELMQLTRLTEKSRKERKRKKKSNRKGNKSTKFSLMIARRNRLRTYAIKAPPQGTIRTTREIAETLLHKGRHNHAIPLCGALQLPEQDLPIPPYTLGAWLGDGNSNGCGFTTADKEMVEFLRQDGYRVRKRNSRYAWGILGLGSQLKKAGLLWNKHIPPQYLRASVAQRMELLQGLMDTDGHCRASGTAELCLTNYKLITGALELVQSLGFKSRISVRRAVLNGKDCGPCYTLKFTTNQPIFRLPRKLVRQKTEEPRRTTRFRYIVECERVQSRPMRCISVDNPTGLFLCGWGMTPTHNSDLILGLALTKHHRSLILRRIAKYLKGLSGRIQEIAGKFGRWRSSGYGGIMHSLPNGAEIELGGCELEKDKENYQGEPHDLLAFDEISHFSRTQYQFLIAWNRRADVNQRCRVVCAGNPPTTAEGQWIIEEWAPWLDPRHPDPALPGELRWYTTIKDKTVWFKTGEPFTEDGETIKPVSRTFIPALLKDNPILNATDYRSKLQKLPEPFRSKFLYGKMDVGDDDKPGQLIPTAWVRLAQERWEPNRPEGVPLSQLGVDVARGGRDKTVISPRYGWWFAPLLKHPGNTTKDGPAVAACTVAVHDGKAPIYIDIIAVGTSPYDCLKAHFEGTKVEVVAVNNAATEPIKKLRDKSGTLFFRNVRAASWWKMREALDPEGDEKISLPPDPELLADLCSPTFEVTPSGVQVEPKEKIIERLGRSPDCGDAVVMANWSQSKKVLRVW